MRVKQDARLGASALPGPGWALDRYRPIFRALFSLELELGNTEKSRDLQGALVRPHGWSPKADQAPRPPRMANHGPS